MNDYDKYVALKLSSQGEKAETNMLASLAQSGVFDLCYAKKSRVKTEETLIEKKLRKLAEKPNYDLTDITDVIGIRFVTLFRLEMPIVFKKIIEIINHEDTLNPNPFKRKHIEEIIIYKSNQFDDISSQIIEIATEHSIERNKIEEIRKKREYSSIHIVTRLEHEIEDLSIENNLYSIPVEIQIRTVFEDAWGEIDHKFGYVVGSGKETGIPVQNPDSVARNLKVLKKFADACAEYSDAIHCEATLPNNNGVDQGKVLSVKADQELIDTFQKLKVEPEIIELYTEVRLQRIKAQKSEESNLGSGIIHLLETASAFKDISKQYDPESEDFKKQKNHLVYYYAQMNEAVCLLSTNHKNKILIAQDIYKRLLVIDYFKSFPLLHLRVGQAYGKLGKTDLAITQFEITRDLIISLESGKGHSSSIECPLADYEHIKKYLPIRYGYELWKKSEEILGQSTNDISNKIDLLSNAYNITQEVSKNSGEIDIHQRENNLLYYSIELLKNLKISPLSHFDETEKTTTQKIKKHLSKMEEFAKEKNFKNINFLETLSYAYELLESPQKAEEMNKRIIDIGLDQEQNISFDKNHILEIIELAYARNKKINKKNLT